MVEDGHSSVICNIRVRDLIQENPGNDDLSCSLTDTLVGWVVVF